MNVGQTASVRRVVDQSDFDRFAALSGDDNPIHVDPEFAAQTRFGRTVAHGMFLYSLASGVLGSRLPGPGTVQLVQELMFPTPTFVGESVTIKVAVTDLNPAERRVDLSTLVLRPDGSLGLEGRTAVLAVGGLSGTWPPMPGNGKSVPEPGARGFKGLAVGQQSVTRRAFTADDLEEYADLTGDNNPVYHDRGFARRNGLADLVVPGPLLGGLFSYLLGTKLPGPGTNYLKQRLEFPAATYVGRELVAVVEVARLRPEKQLVNLRTVCTSSDGTTVCQGEALVLVQDVASEEDAQG